LLAGQQRLLARHHRKPLPSVAVIRVLQSPAGGDSASQLLRTEKFSHIRQFTKVLKGACGRSKQKSASLFNAGFVISIGILND
jgi:hypothetical protein